MVFLSIDYVTMRTCIVEKNLTIDRKLGGPDAAFSLEPDEFKVMVKSAREAERL